MTAPKAAPLRAFTMKLNEQFRALMVRHANDAGVTASDWIRALILLSHEDSELNRRVVDRARALRRTTGRTGS